MSAANEISMGHLEGLLRAIVCSLASKISKEAGEWLDEEGRVSLVNGHKWWRRQVVVSIMSRMRGHQNKMIRVAENRRAKRSGVVRNNKKKRHQLK